MVFRTRSPKYWVFGPSGIRTLQPQASSETAGHPKMCLAIFPRGSRYLILLIIIIMVIIITMIVIVIIIIIIIIIIIKELGLKDHDYYGFGGRSP